MINKTGFKQLTMAKLWRLTLLAVLLHASEKTCAFPDWLVDNVDIPTKITSDSPETITINNGLISRTFTLSPDFATIDYYSFEKQSSILRAISPEAVIALDGIIYNVGGLNTSIPRAYLNRTALVEDINGDDRAFHYVSHEVTNPLAPFPYTPQRGAPKDIAWPPKGKRLDVLFRAPYWAPLYHQKISVIIHYEMYDGIPLMTKWITVAADPGFGDKVQVQVQFVESLAVNYQWANGYSWMYVQTDQAHNAKVQWALDSASEEMPGSFEWGVNCSYESLPYLFLDQNFTSFKVMEVLIGSNDHERTGLAQRKMMRLLAPHTQENPIFFHMVYTNSTAVRAAIDQMSEVGFEMLIFSFGSGFNYESDDEDYIAQLAEDVAYAKARGIEVGGYDLIAFTRVVEPQWMAKNDHEVPSACFASGWADYLLQRVLNMMNKTGMSFIESDGPYSGYNCSSTNHTHHKGQSDSIYKQTIIQNQFYTTLRAKGVYINQPDNYFYQGGSKTAMGYNENQYSLPRWQDLSVSRQGMYDDTFHNIPTVGWMFVPLVQYHGGGSLATFEPLLNHTTEYDWALAQYLGSGVAACYRGYRLYDSLETKKIVQKWVYFYKKYRDIITSDIIHVRRADMQGIDCLMHVNPTLENKALAMVFNPTNDVQVMNLTLPLYYSGISYMAQVSREGGAFVKYPLDRQYNIEVHLKLPPFGITWYLLQGK